MHRVRVPGTISVPITFLDKHNNDQFEIVGDNLWHDGNDTADPINVIDGRQTYRRILIKAKRIEKKDEEGNE